MSSAFSCLSSAVCAELGVPTPLLAPDPDGALSFTLHCHGTLVTTLWTPYRAGHVFLMAEAARGDSVSPEMWAAHMAANMRAQSHGLPIRSRDPEAGDLVLLLSLPLAAATAAQVVDALGKLAAECAACREPPVETQDGDGCIRELVTMPVGTPSPRRYDAAVVELMEANFSWMTHHPPLVAGRDEATGEMFIGFVRARQGEEPADPLPVVEAIAEWVQEWEALAPDDHPAEIFNSSAPSATWSPGP